MNGPKSDCDAFLMGVTIQLSWRDRLRALCGRTIRVTCYGVEAQIDRPEVLKALARVDSFTTVDRLFYLRRRGRYVVEEEKPSGYEIEGSQ